MLILTFSTGYINCITLYTPKCRGLNKERSSCTEILASVVGKGFQLARCVVCTAQLTENINRQQMRRTKPNGTRFLVPLFEYCC